MSVLAVKYTTLPLVPFFKAVGAEAEKSVPLIGQIGTVKSQVLDASYGQVEVLRDKDSPALLNCMLSEDHKPLERGQEVIVIRLDEKSKKYIVRSLSVKDHEGSDSDLLSKMLSGNASEASSISQEKESN